MTQSAMRGWLAELLSTGLDTGLISSADITGAATPEVLSTHLPAPLMARLLSESLKAGAMTPDGIVECLGAQALATHLPVDIIWTPLAKGYARGHGQVRTFLERALTSGLKHGQLTPDAIMTAIPADVLASSLPRPLWSTLLSASLGAAKMDAALIVGTLGVGALTEHIPTDLVFACISAAVGGASSSVAPRTSHSIAPALAGAGSAPIAAAPLSPEPTEAFAPLEAPSLSSPTDSMLDIPPASPSPSSDDDSSSTPSGPRVLGPAARRMPGRRDN